VQVPPAGEWESRGEVRYTLAEAWIGRPLGEPEAGQEHIVHRYLTAFGPASLADIGAWSGLSRLRAVLDRLAPQLRTFTDEAGGTLYDVADGTLGDADDAAPARLLPDYDNVLFAHKDRTRVLPEEYRGTVVPTGRRMPGTFLVDGFVAGTWRIECTGTLAALHLAPFGRLRRPARDELVQEAERLVRFAEPDAARHEVRLPS
ncbi:MAG: winged helix DNA-binding domain-containing protein, partial [Acidimicrobiia bacterium]